MRPLTDPRSLSRRSLLAVGATASGGLLLPGCASLTAAPAAPPIAVAPAPACLPRINVDRSRVIRTVAGLRPYRASGFVVRQEALGTKRVVHNYGHGGAGITLSWGTARLAADLGLQGHTGPVCVIGAGVVGLSTARLVLEAGFAVTLHTATLGPDTTSHVAGGQFNPVGHYSNAAVTPEWRVQYRRAVDEGWRRFQLLVGDEYGVRWLPTFVEASTPQPPLTPTFRPVNRSLGRDEHPFPLDDVVRFDTLYVETGRYLRQLLRDFRLAGGQVRIGTLPDRAAVEALPETLIFNCTGLGARALFGDTELVPIRGQLAVLLPQPEIAYAYAFDAGYMFPRPDGLILGGTYERGAEDPTPQDADITRILAKHAELMAGWRCG